MMAPAAAVTPIMKALVAAAADGAFCLHWQAHGLRYGIPARYASQAAAGAVVVANVSRAVVGPARAALLPAATIPLHLERLVRNDYDPYRPAGELSPLRRQWRIWRASRGVGL